MGSMPSPHAFQSGLSKAASVRPNKDIFVFAKSQDSDFAHTPYNTLSFRPSYPPPTSSSSALVPTPHDEHPLASPSTETLSTARPAGPIRAVLAIFKRWALTDSQGAIILGADHPSFIDNLRHGDSVRGRDALDRVRLLLNLYEGIFTLFHDENIEKQWLQQPKELLDGKSLLDLMTEGSMVNLILALDHVDYVNGR